MSSSKPPDMRKLGPTEVAVVLDILGFLIELGKAVGPGVVDLEPHRTISGYFVEVQMHDILCTSALTELRNSTSGPGTWDWCRGRCKLVH
jgi:hypothetical protein